MLNYFNNPQSVRIVISVRKFVTRHLIRMKNQMYLSIYGNRLFWFRYLFVLLRINIVAVSSGRIYIALNYAPPIRMPSTSHPMTLMIPSV